jgi:hypothetical protein
MPNLYFDPDFFNQFQFNEPSIFRNISEHYKNKYRDLSCSNCNEKGHIIKQCPNSIMSYGIIAYTDQILFDKIQDNYSEQKIFELAQESVKSVQPDTKYITPSKKNIRFLMIQRKNTMGFIDLIRGKYPITNFSDILLTYFNEMTYDEKELLRTKTFLEIWNYTWNNKNSNLYKKEYINASLKYQKLDINYYINKSNNSFKFSELSFAKGRKSQNESDKKCAQREFTEETGYNSDSYDLLNYPVIEEEFIGTNKIKYKHIYYLAKLKKGILPPKVDQNNMLQCGEVHAIALLTYQECMNMIRPYDIQKKNVLSGVYNDILTSTF